MKSILLSIKPKWVAKILNGEKTIEIRKTMPKCDYPIDVYIYCTKEDSLIKLQERYKNRYICEQEFRCDDFPKMYSGYEGKGKVVAKFTLNKVRIIGYPPIDLCEQDIKESCLSAKELLDYSKEETIYGWCIDNLEIFDKPKELGEFYKGFTCKYCKGLFSEDTHIEEEYLVQPIRGGYQYSPNLTKAPQNYCYIEVE